MKSSIASGQKSKAILEKYHQFAKKSYGQNFIIDPNTVAKIAHLAKVDNKTRVLEIGPGLGALTQHLCEKAFFVTAVEIDGQMVEILHDTCGEYKNLEIIHQDFLTFDVQRWASLAQYQDYHISVCANLPYYITTPILFRLFESKVDFKCITVMMQKEVAYRMVALKNTKDYNALSVIVQYLYHVSVVMNVSKNVFMPKPKVDSAVVQFETRFDQKTKPQTELFELIKACFKQRRKTMYNNLSEYVEDRDLALEYLLKASIDPQRRAESCDIEEFIKLYEVIYES